MTRRCTRRDRCWTAPSTSSPNGFASVPGCPPAPSPIDHGRRRRKLAVVSKNIGRVSGTPSPNRARIGREVVARLEGNPGVRRAKVENAQIFTYPDFLSEAECDMLVALIAAAARPSTLLAAH